MELKDSKTRVNLMRAFAGECQARSRYDMAASVARKEGHQGIAKVFEYTAKQELAHAKVFYDFLKASNGEVITLDTAYPVNSYDTTAEHLGAAKKNEYEEWEEVYSEFARVAKEEGFDAIANAFEMISRVEKIHGDRFDKYLNEINNSSLYKEDTEVQWQCSNCGAIIEGTSAPEICPVCKKKQGYFTKNTCNPVNIQ
ncbi:MAG: rubrerythrin family protein [Ruminococcaceae bacterium]|nr:rubrerythrin family protein [Oscillospiraceae bacterium]